MSDQQSWGAVTDHYGEIKTLGVEVLTMGTDTIFSHKVWKETSPIIKKVKIHGNLVNPH